MDLVTEVLAGNRLSLARLLTQIENGSATGQQAMHELFPHTGNAYLIGVTGAPGTGKSSLVNQLARAFRTPKNEIKSYRVAVVAVDPSSPFTGGAILGDRIRMRELSGDSGIFIRSMASRGALGGIARATSNVVHAFDAAGYEIILIETVGAGQAEVDIARLAHTTLVVEAPGLGDDIQAIKAGILEIADILVINKADRPGVEITEQALKNMLQLAHPVRRIFRHHHAQIESVEDEFISPPQPMWMPLLVRSVATDGVGIDEIVEAIQKHHRYLKDSGEWRKRDRARLESEMEDLLKEKLVARWRKSIPDQLLQETIQQMLERRVSPQEAVRKLAE